MQNRTYIKDIVEGTNTSVFGFVLSYIAPKKTHGSDYQMIITIRDESSKQKIPVQLFFSSQESFPKEIIERETVIKIENLNMKQRETRACYLVDRKKGCFFFKAKKERMSHVPYFECSGMEYVGSPSETEELERIHKHFYNEITESPRILSTVTKLDLLFTAYVYIKQISGNSILTNLLVCDPSTDRQLRVRVWAREIEELPKKDTCVCIFNLKVKKIDQAFIIADVSRSSIFKWTSNIPKEVQMLFGAYKLLNSKHFVNTVARKINKLDDHLENSSIGNYPSLEEKQTEEGEHEYTGEKDSFGHKLKPLLTELEEPSSFHSAHYDPIIIDEDILSDEKEPAAKRPHSSEEPCAKRVSNEEQKYTEKSSNSTLSIEKEGSASMPASSVQQSADKMAVPCTSSQTIDSIIGEKEAIFSFKETDRIYDELLNLPIKPYYTNLDTKVIAFDDATFSILSPKSDALPHVSDNMPANISMQTVSFYKKVPIIYHMFNKRSPDTHKEISGYVLVASKTKPTTIHVLLCNRE
ncbi:hypothetical protein NEMIN01_1667 [Nematocida minor]|uniref:uncharacterized protein n=1 Tax=Nematocida minor TaxID=1912983 RepID=UPI0022204DEE|nr:uncharacterized protein NEMIN01_1667 [Nematocida minor]KAI5191776.1 hypothetical protein NEMIN01_1667 [Nematocida minor]